MPYSPRLFCANNVYEICFRAKSGLPFVSMKLISFLLKSALARVQRDNKVTLCHFIFNGSHCHIIIVVKDAHQCMLFYSELMKKITDISKRLLGLNYLNLWEKRPMVAHLAEPNTVIERIAYLYANPALDSLVNSIAEFPGLSSYREFLCANTLEYQYTHKTHWIRLPSIPIIGRKSLNKYIQEKLIRKLVEDNKKRKELLVVCPNAWMKCFSYDNKAVEELNIAIKEAIKAKESKARQRRKKEKKALLGKQALRNQGFMKAHRPKKYSSNVFIICYCKDLRVKLIKAHEAFRARCRYCYEQYVKGNFTVTWPPEAFKPPLPPLVCLLAL